MNSLSRGLLMRRVYWYSKPLLRRNGWRAGGDRKGSHGLLENWICSRAAFFTTACARRMGQICGASHLERPIRMERRSNRVAVFIRKRIDENDPFRRNDLAINKLAPHIWPIRRAHAVV